MFFSWLFSKNDLWTLEDQNKQYCTRCCFCASICRMNHVQTFKCNLCFTTFYIHFFIEIFGLLNEWLYNLTIYNIHMWCSFIVLLFHFVKHADRSIHFMTPFCNTSSTHSHCSIVANTHYSYKLYIQHGVFNKVMQKVWWNMLSYSRCFVMVLCGNRSGHNCLSYRFHT